MQRIVLWTTWGIVLGQYLPQECLYFWGGKQTKKVNKGGKKKAQCMIYFDLFLPKKKKKKVYCKLPVPI